LAARQNTDPYVFGPVFLFSNCRQFTYRLRPTRLQQLPPGSVVVFGSHLGGQFVVDTVLVVASRTPYAIGRPDQPLGRVSAAFRVATLQPLAGLERFRGRTAQLYRGVSFNASDPNRMFSFVPARLDGARFSRPALPGSPFITPAMTMGFKAIATSADQARVFWQDIIDRVRSHGLDLAIHLAEPRLLQHDPATPATEPTGPSPATCTPTHTAPC